MVRDGGTGALVRGVARLFADDGGTVRLRSEVSEIMVDATMSLFVIYCATNRRYDDRVVARAASWR